MNARVAVFSVVILALLAVVSTPAFAGTCVKSGDQCFNSTYTTAGGGEQLQPGDPLLGIDPDPRIAASANSVNCEAAGGVWYSGENMDIYPVCRTACCCNGNQAEVKAPANMCAPGTTYTDKDADETCEQACGSGSVPSLPQCGEGTIQNACVCGNTPAAPADISSGHYCCWNGQIASSSVACQAKPSDYCAFNTPITRPCTCGTAEISSGVCCSNSIPKSSASQCSATTTPGGAVCGNLIQEGYEACDASYDYRNGAWIRTSGESDCASGQICSTSCGCVTVGRTPVCGDGVCDGTETTAACAIDCPAQATCTDSSLLPPIALDAEWNDVDDVVELGWEHPTSCAANRGGYRLQRSTVSIAAASTSPSQVWYLSRDTTAFIDSPPATETTIVYYALYATYNGGQSERYATDSVSIPNALCPGSGVVSYCMNSTFGVNCNQYAVVSTANCTTTQGQPSSICTVSTGLATCMSASSQCERCNGPFGMFPDGDTMVSVGTQRVACSNPESTCYKDLGETSVEYYKSCTSVRSCGSYRSEQTCEQNPCGVASGADSCEWLPSGYCRATDEPLRKCSDCTIENGCNEQLCTAVGGDECYFYDPPSGATTRTDLSPGCYAPEEVVCEMYTSEATCTGGSDFALNTTYSGNTRTSGDNTYRTLSNDLAGRGKCLWTPTQGTQPGYCARDADDTNTKDFGNTATLAQLRDFTNPSSGVLGSPNATYTRESTVRFTSDSPESYQCIARPQDACYPDENLIQGGEIPLDPGTPQANGTWVLRHYSVDGSKNLEFVKEFPYRIDLDVPVITITTNQTTYLFGTSGRRTNVDVRVNVSEFATCESELVRGGDTVSGVYELDRFGQNFSYSYTGLTDGSYLIYITCVDTSANEFTQSHPFIVDTNADITRPSPSSLVPPLNYTNVEIRVETAKVAACKYGQAGTNYNQMSFFTDTGARVHTSRVGVNTGEYRYIVACEIDGAIVYGNASDDIVFAVDTIGPSVTLCDADRTPASTRDCSTTRFINNASERHRVSFRCADQPLATTSFGCEQAAIYSCIEENGRCDFAPYAVRDVPGQQPVLLRYYAIDRGGNRGAEQRIMLNMTDLTPPEVTFTIT